jgi:Uma2 family endonuclease
MAAMSDTALVPRPIAREATRHAFTIDELLEMEAKGAFKGQRTQLLDGEIHFMPSDGLRHINYAMEIGARIITALKPRGFFIGVQTTLHLSRYNAPSPDVYVLSPGPLVKETPPERVLLVVEVADTSLRDDLTDSASRYARHGVQEFWVVDVDNRITHVHREPANGAYAPLDRIPFEAALSPGLIGGLAMRLAEFDPPA